MDYAKLDAGLALAVDAAPTSDARDLDVFVHLTDPLETSARDRLVALGVGDVGSGRTILSATLSAREIASLSDERWIHKLSLGRTLRLLGGR